MAWAYLSTYKRPVPGKRLEDAELGDFHHASHTPTPSLPPPAKKCSRLGPLGQALAKEGTGKPRDLRLAPSP